MAVARALKPSENGWTGHRSSTNVVIMTKIDWTHPTIIETKPTNIVICQKFICFKTFVDKRGQNSEVVLDILSCKAMFKAWIYCIYCIFLIQFFLNNYCLNKKKLLLEQSFFSQIIIAWTKKVTCTIQSYVQFGWIQLKPNLVQLISVSVQSNLIYYKRSSFHVELRTSSILFNSTHHNSNLCRPYHTVACVPFCVIESVVRFVARSLWLQ